MREVIVMEPGDTEPAVLRRIERLVGQQHQRVGACGMFRAAGDPDADADPRLAESGKQMGTAERRGVILADAFQQLSGDFLQQGVAGGVAEPVVDVLEAVEIEAEQRAGIAAIGLCQRIVEACIEQQAVRKLGPAVVPGQEFDLRFGAAPLGNVFIGAYQSPSSSG
jgi:hypothetical protein